jgi:hypothetical protein
MSLAKGGGWVRYFLQRIPGISGRPGSESGEGGGGEGSGSGNEERRKILDRLNSLDPGPTEDERRRGSEITRRLEQELEKSRPVFGDGGSPPDWGDR